MSLICEQIPLGKYLMRLLCLPLLFGLLAVQVWAELPTTKIDGNDIETLVSCPSQGPGPFPLLVIAPAKKYSMTEPLFEDLANSATELGYMVVRFNWRFFTAGTEPSSGLEAETAELEAVIRHFEKDPRAELGGAVLAAKSFGSVVAMRGPWRQSRALLLLTPNSSQQQTFESTYGVALKAGLPVHIVISTTDPYGEIGQLYQALTLAGPQVTVQTLSGDHNFQVVDSFGGLNWKAALLGCANWLSLQMSAPKSLEDQR